MAAERFTDLSRVTDSNSDPLSGGLWYFYTKGTLTPLAVYTTDALDVAHDHPVVADAGGLFPAIYFDSSLEYRGIQKTAAGVPIQDIPLINTEVIERRDGRVNINARTASTAAALETLADTYAGLDGFAGATHTVETTPYPTRVNIDLNGATLENVSAEAISSIYDHGVLTIGMSHPTDTEALTFYALDTPTAGDNEVTLTTVGEAANFAVDDFVLIRGATQNSSGGNFYTLVILRAKILAITSGTLTLDTPVGDWLVDDAPLEIANIDEGYVNAGGETYRLIDHPQFGNGTIVSEGKALARSNARYGYFHDFFSASKNLFALNALTYCTIENVSGRVWQKVIELADNSIGTTVRGVKGVSFDHATEAFDSSLFLLGEGGRDNLIEDVVWNSGPKTIAGDNMAIFTVGAKNCGMCKFSLEAPALTGGFFSFQGNTSFAGFDVEDCFVEDAVMRAVAPTTFVRAVSSVSAVKRPRIRRIKAFGTPSNYAVNLKCTDPEYRDSWVEHGDLYMDGATVGGLIERVYHADGECYLGTGLSGVTIRDNYFSDGFNGASVAGIAAAHLANTIEGNDSAANRRNRAAAYISTDDTVVTTTSANTTLYSATFAAGDLEIGDQVFIYSVLAATGTGTSNRNIRMFASTPSAGKQAGGTAATGTTGTTLEVIGSFLVTSNTQVVGSFSIGGALKNPNVLTIDNITSNAVTFGIEAWMTAVVTSESITPRGNNRIIAVKRGMVHPELR